MGLSPVDAERIRTLKEQASRLAAAGSPEAAVAAYLEVLDAAPGDVGARQSAAELLAQLGRTGRAIAHYQVLVGKYASEGHLLQAIAFCHAILELDPSHAETRATLDDLFARRDTPLPLASSGRASEGKARASAAAVDPATLDRIPLFADLGQAAFASIAGKLKARDVVDGETIVEEGEPGRAMYAIARGAVRVVRRTEGREPRAVAEMCEGEFFGEMSLLSGAPRFATVVAVGEGQLLELAQEDLSSIAADHPAIGDAVARFHKERLLANVLRVSPILGLVADNQRAMLADVLHLEAHAAGAVLLEEGQPGKGFFVLLRGRCDVFHRTADGREMYYPPMHEGDVFGELSILQNGPVTANVRTGTPCVVLSMARQWFDELLLQNAQTRAALYQLAGERFQRTREIIFREELEKRLI
jgi:cAMP-dependent protein kinase regulator